MASEQKKLKSMEKPGLGYGQFAASQLNGKPFSIREYALMSRQRNIEQSWPFSQKYLKLCLDKGITNILPPIETRRTYLDGLHGRFAVGSGKISRTKLSKAEKKSRPVKISSLKEDTISLLCEKLGRLSLSSNGGALVGQKRGLVAKPESQISNNVQSFKAQTSFHESNCEKGRRRKRKTKTKSMVEIMAVAKHCILRGNERIIVSGCTSTAFHEQNADEKYNKNLKGVSSSVTSSRSIEPDDGFSSMRKRKRCSDGYVTGISRFNQRIRGSMDAINYKNDVCCKYESRKRKPSSCRTAEIEKKAGGFERKALKRHPIQISVVEMQDHNAC